MQTQILELTQLARAKRSAFGEFLVEQAALDRFQLFRALQLQDRVPGARLGQCAVALGFVKRDTVEQLHLRFARLHREPDLEHMQTEAFSRDPIEIIRAI